MSLVLRCEDHPTYTGKRKPKTDCLACYEIWSGLEPTPKYPREEGTNSADTTYDPAYPQGGDQTLFWN